MNTIQQTFTTSDGKTFATRKEAVAHQAFAARVEKVKSVFGPAEDDGTLAGLNVYEQVAKLGDELIAALLNPLNRGRKAAPKADAAAPAPQAPASAIVNDGTQV